MQGLTYLFISVFHCVALRSPWLKVDVFNFIFLYGITVYALVEFFPLALFFFHHSDMNVLNITLYYSNEMTIVIQIF